MGNGSRESEDQVEALERTSSVRNATEEVAEATEADICVGCEKRENPEHFWKARQAGKRGVTAISKGPKGIPGKLGLCALLMAPKPGVDPTCCVAGPQAKPRQPTQLNMDSRVCGMGHACRKPTRFMGFCPGSLLGKRPRGVPSILAPTTIFINRGGAASHCSKS